MWSDLAWVVAFRLARLADAAVHGYVQARRRYEEDVDITTARHHVEDLEYPTYQQYMKGRAR